MKHLLPVLFAMLAVIGTAHAVNNCTGATYYDSDSNTCIACPAGYDYNTESDKTDITQCQIHCDAGTYIAIIGDYTQLEYIESTGTQWIDTGITFNSNIGYEFEYQPKTTNNFVTEAGTTGQVIAQLGNVWEFRFNGSTNRRPSPATIDLTQFVNIKYNIDSKCSIDDRVVSIGDLTLNTGGSLRLFGPNYKSSGRMKFFTIYENGTIVKHLIPARRNSDGVVGMYDRVSGQFFTNSGTGTFIAGPNTNEYVGGKCIDVGAGYYASASTVNYGSIGTRTACPIGTYSAITNAASCAPCAGATYNDTAAATSCKLCPVGYDYNTESGKTDITQCQVHCNGGTYFSETSAFVGDGYTRLEYIESTGTQWIDTQISEADIDYIEMDFESQSGGYMLVNGSTQIGMNEERYGTTSLYTRYQIKQERVDNRWYFTNLSNGVTYTQPWVAGSANLYLFTLNGDSRFSTSAKVYSFRCNSNGILSHNFIPARRNSDNVIGMYDTVSGQFFTNSGTGTFTAGPIVDTGCSDVGAGYYASASTVNFGSIGTRTACPAGLTTVGYGHGADEENDCGRILHVGNSIIYTRRNKETTRALNIDMGNDGIFYINLSPTNHNLSRLHFSDVVNTYTAYDDSLIYGERDFDTGQKIE